MNDGDQILNECLLSNNRLNNTLDRRAKIGKVWAHTSYDQSKMTRYRFRVWKSHGTKEQEVSRNTAV